MSEVKLYHSVYPDSMFEHKHGDYADSYIAASDIKAEEIRAAIGSLKNTKQHWVDAVESLIKRGERHDNCKGKIDECEKHIDYFQALLRVAG